MREAKLNELDALFAEQSYPLERDEAREAFSDVTLQLADGSVNLGETIGKSTNGPFESPEGLRAELMNLLPRSAVGEPYQSEGEG